MSQTVSQKQIIYVLRVLDELFWAEDGTLRPETTICLTRYLSLTRTKKKGREETRSTSLERSLIIEPSTQESRPPIGLTAGRRCQRPRISPVASARHVTLVNNANHVVPVTDNSCFR